LLPNPISQQVFNYYYIHGIKLWAKDALVHQLSLEEREEMQQKLQLVPSRIGVYESWASFPLGDYKQVLAFGVFLTPSQNLLLVNDQGAWRLPYEQITLGKFLFDTPDRLVASELGLQPDQLLPHRENRRVKIIGACVHEESYFVFLRIPVERIYRLRKASFVHQASLPRQEEVEAVTNKFVATSLGWGQQPERLAA